MSVELAFLVFWLLMTVAGLLIWRSGGRFGGRSIVQIGAISSVGAAGIWLTDFRPGSARLAKLSSRCWPCWSC